MWCRPVEGGDPRTAALRECKGRSTPVARGIGPCVGVRDVRGADTLSACELATRERTPETKVTRGVPRTISPCRPTHGVVSVASVVVGAMLDIRQADDSVVHELWAVEVTWR